MGKMTFSAEVDQEEVISSVVDNLDQDELASFIESVDGRVGDWDFTKRMYAYFRKEMSRSAEDGGEAGDADEDPDDDEEDDDEDDDVEEDEEDEEDGEEEAPDVAKRKMGEWG